MVIVFPKNLTVKPSWDNFPFKKTSTRLQAVHIDPGYTENVKEVSCSFR